MSDASERARDASSDQGDRSTVGQRLRAREMEVCLSAYREAVTRLETHLDRPLRQDERRVLADLAAGIGGELLRAPLQSVALADEREAAVARRLCCVDED